MLGVTLDMGDLEEKLNAVRYHLSDKQMTRSISLAINLTAKQVRTQSDREIRKIYTIRQSFILKFIKIKNANENHLFADISLPTKPVPIGEFMGIRGGKGVRKSRPVTVEMIRGKRFTLNGAFLFNSKYNNQGSHLAVMHRSKAIGNKSYSGGEFQFRHKRVSPTGKDLPIGAMFSVSPFASVFNKTVRKQIVKVGEEKLANNIVMMLEKNMNGLIRDSSNRGRYRR